MFVTTAYKKKLEERERIEAEERNQEQIEALLDVRKQKDLSGFYYSMLRMRTGELVVEEESEKQKREKEAEAVKFKEQKSSTKQKSYRTTAEEEEEPEEEEEKPKEESSEPNESDKPSEAQIKEEKVDVQEAQVDKKVSGEEKKPNVKSEGDAEPVKEEKTMSVDELMKLKEEQRKERLKKIFEKRTVGDVFDRELSEYFVRKNQNLSLKNFVERE